MVHVPSHHTTTGYGTGQLNEDDHSQMLNAARACYIYQTATKRSVSMPSGDTTRPCCKRAPQRSYTCKLSRNAPCVPLLVHATRRDVRAPYVPRILRDQSAHYTDKLCSMSHVRSRSRLQTTHVAQAWCLRMQRQHAKRDR